MESPALALLVFLGNSCLRWGCLAGGWGSALPLQPPAHQGLLATQAAFLPGTPLATATLLGERFRSGGSSPASLCLT